MCPTGINNQKQTDFSKLEYEIVDNYISIGAPLNVKNMARADKDKLARRSKATRVLSEVLLDRAAKGEASWVIADVPTHGLAQEAQRIVGADRHDIEELEAGIVGGRHADDVDGVALQLVGDALEPVDIARLADEHDELRALRNPVLGELDDGVAVGPADIVAHILEIEGAGQAVAGLPQVPVEQEANGIGTLTDHGDLLKLQVAGADAGAHRGIGEAAGKQQHRHADEIGRNQ